MIAGADSPPSAVKAFHDAKEEKLCYDARYHYADPVPGVKLFKYSSSLSTSSLIVD